MIEHNLKEWNQQQILTQKIIMMNEMNTATQHVDPVVFQPIEDVNMHYDKEEKKMGSISGIAYGKATLEVSSCTAKQQSSATLTLHSQDGSLFSLPPSLISSTLSSPGDRHSVKCPVTQTQPGKYNITFTPSTRNDQLIVQVGGIDVPDSPYTLPVNSVPEMRGEPANIITGLNYPNCIAVFDNGNIVVAESGAHCVTILNKKGKKVRTFGPFNCPHGVAVSIDGHILVIDNHRLQKLTTDGVCVKSVGSCESGSGQLQFHYRTDISVADIENNRIQVFSNDLTFSHTISPTRFSLSRQFDHPHDIAIDNEGYLYIIDRSLMTADHYQFIIFKLDGSTGKYVKRFYIPTPDENVSPSSIAIHKDLVYVSQYNKDSILEISTDGKLQHSLDAVHTAQQSCYWNVSTDVFGNLYICDIGNNRIVVI